MATADAVAVAAEPVVDDAMGEVAALVDKLSRAGNMLAGSAAVFSCSALQLN